MGYYRALLRSYFNGNEKRQEPAELSSSKAPISLPSPPGAIGLVDEHQTYRPSIVRDGAKNATFPAFGPR
jgi:hypothetical protein